MAEWSRWDKYKRAPLRQDSSASASEGWWREDHEQMIVGWSHAVEDYLESCAQVIVDIEVVESFLRPENLEVSLRYVLKHATRRGSNILQLFDTSEKPNHLRRRDIAFENLAKEMLRYLETSEKLNVGVTELQERLEVLVQIVIYTQQVAQQARSENGQKIFEVFWQEEEELCC